MKRALIILISALVLLLVSSSSAAWMADDEKIEKSGDGEEASVHIVYIDRPEGVDAEAFHIRTLASVLGSEEAAKEALIYHYKHAASGFSAKLTPKQVAELSKKPEVLQVLPSRTLHLQGPRGGRGIRPGVM